MSTFKVLQDFCHIVQGGRHKLSGNDFVSTGYPAYGAGGMNGMLPDFEFDEPAVVLSSIGARCGKCFFVQGKWSSLANTQVIRPNLEISDPKYLWYQLNDEKRWHRAGTGQPFIKPSDVKSHRVFLPPLPEQRRIAAILDQAETLRNQRRTALAQLDSLTQSIFLDIFKNDLAHPPMGTLSDVMEGFRYGTSEKSGDTGFPALRIPNIASGALDLQKLKTVEVQPAEFDRLRLVAGDLLFVRTNGNPDYVGRCAVFNPALVVGTGFDPDSFIYASYLIRGRLRAKTLMPVVLQQYLSEGEGRKALRSYCKTSAGQYNINTEGLGAIPVPSFSIRGQQTFAARIQSIEALKAKHRAALAELDALFASLQHRAFNGELTAQAPTLPKPRRFAELGQLNTSKGLEALVYAAHRLPNKGHYWPLKVQYVADRRHLERRGRSLYGETHVAMPYGPVPQAAFNASRALASGELICEFPMDAVRAALRRDGETLVALRDADPGVLGADERESLDWAIRLVADMSFDELKTQTHDSAWEKTPRNAPMAWQDIIESLAPAARQRLREQFE